MSDGRRNRVDVQNLFQSCKGFSSEQTMKFYNSWAETYEQDLDFLDYRATHLATDFLDANFSGNREDVQVLDVACGTGRVAKLMFKLGFRKFVGVDCSEGMLEQAAQTGLYQDVRLALLGTQPLLTQAVTFDLVVLVGGLGVGFIPVSVVRELCQAAKPGGFICLARGTHSSAAEEEFEVNLKRELQLMEDEGLWSQIAFKLEDKYMLDPQQETDKDTQKYISGSLYLFKKSIM